MISRVLAIIVDYHTSSDAEALSIQLAESLAQHPASSLSVQILHMDNGNLPPIVPTQRQTALSVQVSATGENLGYAGALNFAVKYCQKLNRKFDAFWFLNSDLEIEPDCLPKLVRVLNENPKVGAVGPIVREFIRRDHTWGARGKVSPLLGTTAMTDWKQGGALPKWSYIPGCSLLVRTSAYEQVGGLPERYKLYYEETDFCIQLQRAGWDLWVEPDATVYHKVDSLKAGIPARHFAYYFIRNNLSFWKVCFGIPIWLQLPRTIYVACREVLLPLRRAKNWAEVFDRLKYLYAGIVDGILFSLNRPLLFERKLFK